MKDPIYEIISAITTLLTGSMSYGSYKFSVYDTLPETTSNKYVWFPNALIVDESTQDKYRHDVTLTIQVVIKGQQRYSSRQAIADIGSDLLTILIKRSSLTMANHVLSVKPYLENITHETSYQDGSGLTLSSDYVIRFETQQK